MGPQPRFPAALALAAALAAGGFCVPAAAQMRAAPAGGSWTPPFAPAGQAVFGGIQSLLGTPAGLTLAAELPSVQALRSYSPSSDMDLRVVGAMSARLPDGFEARLTGALQRAKSDPAALAPLAREVGEAYRAAAPEVARAVDARAKQVAAAVAYGQMDGREIVLAAEQLERFGVYGPAAQDNARIVRRLASQNLMENAQKVAADFLRSQRRADDGATRAGGASGAYGPTGRKEMPEDWRIRAYRKAAEAAAAADRAAKPPPSPQPKAAPKPAPQSPTAAKPAPAERKASPMSDDLYERIGAVKGMNPAELEAAYKKAAELHRPERYLDRDARSLIILTMASRKITDAYEVLKDPARRAEYDAGRRAKEAPAPNPLSDDYYERIGATRGMSEAELKKAYRRAAMEFHPDKAQSKGEALKNAMTVAFQNLQEAYGTLEDAPKRAAYDRRPVKSAPRR